MAYHKDIGFSAIFTPKDGRVQVGGEAVAPASIREPDVRLLELAMNLQEQLEDRGVASGMSFQEDMLELRCAKEKSVLLRGPKACCIVLRLDVPNARRLSQELDRVPPGATSRSLVFEAFHQAMFGEAATTHHFEKGMRVEVVAGIHTGRFGNIGEKSTLGREDWIVYLDSPAGCKRQAVGRKRATRHFSAGELVPVEEEPAEDKSATPACRLYHAAIQGWTDGAGRKAIRPGMADHPRVGTVYLDAYTRGQRASREEAERIAAQFDYRPSVIRPCGGG